MGCSLRISSRLDRSKERHCESRHFIAYDKQKDRRCPGG